jgi:hypothetical protein
MGEAIYKREIFWKLLTECPKNSEGLNETNVIMYG